MGFFFNCRVFVKKKKSTVLYHLIILNDLLTISIGRVAREEADDESVNNDPLPFDPKDATEPVEV